MDRLRRLPHPLIALLVAVLIVVVAYPEVVFLGGSLSPVGLNGVIDARTIGVSVSDATLAAFVLLALAGIVRRRRRGGRAQIA
jgi:MYXO-CTERM domain-containing protein